METVSRNRSFGGWQGVYTHDAVATSTAMTFAVYMPDAAEKGPVPALLWLSGLTCTHANAMEKAGAQRAAAELGMAVIFPDTSPRGEGVANDDAYDLGQGAGFYVNATEAPWAPHFKMESYVLELLDLVTAEFPIDAAKIGVSGHSMGGHGALTLAMRHPERFASASAFAPIVNPTASDWGRKQFAAYLGDDERKWADHDASLLIGSRGWKGDLLVDQGDADNFLPLLMPESFERACAAAGQSLTLRMQPGYDHSYYFVSTFIPDHMAFHAKAMSA